MPRHLAETLRQLGHPRVLVLGDAILDRYIWGNAERVSQEAPVILLRADRDEARLGGAANVAHMLRGLETDVTLASVVGNDFHSRTVRDELERIGIDGALVLTDPDRPTTVKERFMGRAQNRHPHQMLRVDREVREPLSAERTAELLPQLIAAIPMHQAVLISDYGKGVCTPHITAEVIRIARQVGVPVVVDPRPGSDYGLYRGATAVTPNRLETKLATGLEIATEQDAIAAGRKLCHDLALDHAYVTLDSDGICVVRSDGPAQLVPTRKRQVYDITGAGDMVLATIGMGLAAGIDPVELARLANVAGGLEVERVGVVPITRDEMLADIHANDRSGRSKICPLDELEIHLAARRRQGERIVFTNGCFDLLHAGHVAYLEQAAGEGDCLIVGLNSDESVRRLNKGPERPIIGERQRAAMLAALEAVDFVVIFEESTPQTLLARLKPDLLVKGGAYRHDEIVGWEQVESYGGAVKALGHLPGLSTTNIIERLRQSGDIVPHPQVDVAGMRNPAGAPGASGKRDEDRDILPELGGGHGDGDAGLTVGAPRVSRGGDRRGAPSVRLGRARWPGPRRPRALACPPRRGGRGPATSGWRFAAELRRDVFDWALLLPNSFRSAWWARLSGARRRVGFARNGRGWLLTEAVAPRPKHTPHPVLDEYLRLAKGLGCTRLSRSMELATTPADEKQLSRFWRRQRLGRHEGRGVVTLNPGGAFGAAKHWPVTSFAELALRIASEFEKRVLVLCGPSERNEAREIVSLARHPAVFSLADEPPSIGLTKAAVRHSELLVTTDSGPRHFLPPFGVPVITLFGPTHTAWSETRYDRSLHLQLELECGPCQQRVCPLIHHRCMRELSVDWVLRATTTMLRKYPARTGVA